MGESLYLDVDAAESLARVMGESGQAMHDRAAQLTNQLGSVEWTGPLANQFRDQWHSQGRRNIATIVQMLEEASQLLADHAQAQRQLSDGDGVVAGAAVAGVAAAGALAQGRMPQRPGQGQGQNGVNRPPARGQWPPAPGFEHDPPEVRDRMPTYYEDESSGRISGVITRDSERFRNELVYNDNPDIVFKEVDDARADSDHMMTPAMRDRVDDLASRVQQEWPGARLRITDAWDEEMEHSAGALHYEGRAVDITVDDNGRVDNAKLGRLYELARDSGFDWVYYENRFHVHASVRRDQ